MFSRSKLILIAAALCFAAQIPAARAAQFVKIMDVPDYDWHAGCFGSASGNLMGFWDRNGFPNMYTGPTAGGVAPLDSYNDNVGIRSLWASRAGFDGRPFDKPGHIDDYWIYYNDQYDMSYESAAPDPYVTEGRPEHAPDCTGDFMGASQNKWTDMNGECNGNIDAFSFNYWDHSGARRVNFTPPPQGDLEVRDIQSGFRRFAEYRGYRADSFSQLTDFNPDIPSGVGFTFNDMKAEIDAGYPVMLFLQQGGLFRDLPGAPHMNPEVHGMIAYGYRVLDGGAQIVYYRTSWASGDNQYHLWTSADWAGLSGFNLRGVIGFHPKPQIMSVSKNSDGVSVKWDGPGASVQDLVTGAVIPVHYYVLEKATSLAAMDFAPVTDPGTNHEALVTSATTGNAFYRVKLLDRSQIPTPQ